MKFSIKYKIVALGALLSILVTSSAVLFSHTEFRKREHSNLVNGINEYMDGMNYDLTDASYSEDYLKAIKATKDYIIQQYEIDSDDAPEEYSTEDKKNFYKDRFRWLYTIENFGLYPMSDEEILFRANYEELIYLLSDAKSATKTSTVYMSFVYNDTTLFYMGDYLSYKKIMRDDMLFPGSRLYNFDGEFKSKGNYLDCSFNNKKNRVLPVYYQNELICYVFYEYDFIQVNKDVDKLVITEIIVLSIASVLMILAYALASHFIFIRNVTKLNKTSSEFKDDLDKGNALSIKDPHINSHDEISALSKSFVSLEESIIQYIDVIQKETKEKERTNAELSLASNIQLGALPNHIYDDDKVAIRAFIKSAKEIGGDFYDYFYLDDGRLVVLISDVSGKGIPAALFMMKSKELIKSALSRHEKVVDAIKEVNSLLASNNNELLFVTSFVGVIDFKNHKIDYVNAGHEKPYIFSNKGLKKLEGESNFVMGALEDFDYKQEEAPFNKGDYLFLFTDGLNESINENNEEFSYRNIEKILEENKDSSPSIIIENMFNGLNKFVGDKEQFDDVTMLIVKYLDDELYLSYDKKDYSIITDAVDKFNNYFSHIKQDIKSKCGIILDELLNNFISYEKKEDLIIDIDFKVNKKEIEILIRSNGDDYDPFINHQEKYLEEFHQEIEEGGFGLSIIKDLSKSYSYEYKDHHSYILIKLDNN